MKTYTLDHPWMDKEFYTTGSYLSVDGGASVLFCKGGVVKTSNAISELNDTTYVKKFFSDEYLVHVAREKLILSLTEEQDRIKSNWTEIDLIKTESNQDQVFQADFESLKKVISKTLSKAVLLSREEYSSPDAEVLKKNIVAKSFLLNYGRPYGFWSGQMGIVGCTPETLFEIEGDMISSEALAGTAKVGFEKELLASVKDRSEHEFVIQDISEKLASLGLDVFRGETVTSPFAQIIHLRTPIKAHMKKGIGALDISLKLSPTAALGGYPTAVAMDFLKDMNYSKTFPDRIFGSVIGNNSTHSAVGLVMIRNFQWTGKTFIIESGVGVVEASEMSKELSELKMKREAVRNIFL